MFFLIKDEKVLEKYKSIWDKINNMKNNLIKIFVIKKIVNIKIKCFGSKTNMTTQEKKKHPK